MFDKHMYNVLTLMSNYDIILLFNRIQYLSNNS